MYQLAIKAIVAAFFFGIVSIQFSESEIAEKIFMQLDLKCKSNTLAKK